MFILKHLSVLTISEMIKEQNVEEIRAVELHRNLCHIILPLHEARFNIFTIK